MPVETQPRERRQLEVEVAVLQSELKYLKETLSDLTKSVNKLNEMLQQTKGGWFALSLVGSACVALGALGASLIGK